MIMESIKQFVGEYDWLSNFYNCKMMFDGKCYKTSEAAFQAQKCTDAEQKEAFTFLTAGESKRFGKKVALRSDWEQVKVQIMYDVLMAKFYQNPDLRLKLIATGDAILIEGNHWRDKFWGICPVDGTVGVDGLNMLGKLLMKVRTEFKS